MTEARRTIQVTCTADVPAGVTDEQAAGVFADMRVQYPALPGWWISVPVVTAAQEQADPEFPATWAGGHALVIEFGDEELTARCQCGRPLGSGSPATSLETFAQPWETHAMTAGR